MVFNDFVKVCCQTPAAKEYEEETPHGRKASDEGLLFKELLG